MYHTPAEQEAIAKARAEYHRTRRADNRIDAPSLIPFLFGAVSVFAMFAYLGWMWFKELSA